MIRVSPNVVRPPIAAASLAGDSVGLNVRELEMFFRGAQYATPAEPETKRCHETRKPLPCELESTHELPRFPGREQASSTTFEMRSFPPA